MGRHISLSSLLAPLYDAPLDPRRWEEFLQLLTTAVGGDSAAILVHDLQKTAASLAQTWNLDPDSGQDYSQHFVGLDIWRQRLAQHAKRDWVGASDLIVPYSELQRTEFHGDFLRKYEIGHGLFAVMERDHTQAMNLSVYRSRQKGPFSSEDEQLIRSLHSHLRRAMRLHVELAAVRSVRSALESAINSMGTGVILLNGRKQVRAINEEAERILREDDGLALSQGSLHPRRLEERAALDALITNCLQISGPRHGGGEVIISRARRPPLHVMVSRASVEINNLGDAVAVIVFINDFSRGACPRPELLRAVFGLTPAECRLAVLLAAGHSTKEIGQTLGIRANTIKSQLSAIYAKTGTSRQSQLVKLLIRVADVSVPWGETASHGSS